MHTNLNTKKSKQSFLVGSLYKDIVTFNLTHNSEAMKSHRNVIRVNHMVLILFGANSCLHSQISAIAPKPES